MAEILVGDVLARLRADVSQFNQAIQAAIQQMGQLNQATASLRQQQSQGVQASQQQAQQLRGVTQSLQQTTQATIQATTAWRTMLSVAGGIGIATGIGAVVGQLKDLAVSTVQTGARLEAHRASLSALGGSTDGRPAILDARGYRPTPWRGPRAPGAWLAHAQRLRPHKQDCRSRISSAY